MNCKLSKFSIRWMFLIVRLFRKLADERRRRSELLQDIKRKDRRSEHFVKDKQETVHLVQ